MKKYAQILNDKLHWKFEREEQPDFSDEIFILEITGTTPEPMEGWTWNGIEFIPPVVENSELEKVTRLKRNGLLALSDWTQLPDAPLESAEGWKIYRQALRDISKQKEFPSAIVWPSAP